MIFARRGIRLPPVVSVACKVKLLETPNPAEYAPRGTPATPMDATPPELPPALLKPNAEWTVVARVHVHKEMSSSARRYGRGVVAYRTVHIATGRGAGSGGAASWSCRPDFIVRARLDQAWGHVGLAGLVRDQDVYSVGGPRVGDTGWGFMASGHLNTAAALLDNHPRRRHGQFDLEPGAAGRSWSRIRLRSGRRGTRPLARQQQLVRVGPHRGHGRHQVLAHSPWRMQTARRRTLSPSFARALRGRGQGAHKRGPARAGPEVWEETKVRQKHSHARPLPL